MRKPFGEPEGGAPAEDKERKPSYGKSFKDNHGAWFSGMAAGLTNAIITGATTWAGFKTAGPGGAAAGLALGSTASESAKAAVSSWADFRKAKREEKAAAASKGSSGGGGSITAGAGGGGSIQQVKQTASAIASKLSDGDGALAAALDRMSNASTLLEQATQDSTSHTVEQIKAKMAQALEAAGEAMKIAGPSRQAITDWMGKI